MPKPRGLANVPPERRREISRLGAFALHATHDPVETTAKSRTSNEAALNAKLLAGIDEREPGLPEAERQRRLVYARKAHFQRLRYRVKYPEKGEKRDDR